MLKRGPSVPVQPMQLDPFTANGVSAGQTAVGPVVLFCCFKKESMVDPGARSKLGAVGLVSRVLRGEQSKVLGSTVPLQVSHFFV